MPFVHFCFVNAPFVWFLLMPPLFGIPYLKVAHTVFTIALNADIVTLDTKQLTPISFFFCNVVLCSYVCPCFCIRGSTFIGIPLCNPFFGDKVISIQQ